MRATLTIAAVLLAFAAAVSAATNCQSPDGTYDLTSLAGSDLSGSDASYTYKLQVCGTATETTCATNGGSFCQYSNANPPVYSHVLTKWDSTGTWSACQTSTCPNGGVQVYFANGDKCGGSGPARAVTYIINCPTASTPSSTSYVVGTQGCIYTVTMTHSVGCGTRPPNPHNCKSPNGAYDLTPIAGQDIPGVDSSYAYFLRVCGVANETVCGGHSGSMCQYTKTMPSVYRHTLARWDGTGIWSSCTAQDCPNGGVQIYYQNGDRCAGANGPLRDVIFQFACPAEGQPSALEYNVTSDQPCQYVVQMTNKVGCGANATAVALGEL